MFIISTIAGTGSSSYSGDNGQATAAAIYYPHAACLDTAGSRLYPPPSILNLPLCTYLGNVYIADTYNQRIRKVTVSTGIITTIAGIGTSSYGGDGGAATSAGLSQPGDVAVDSAGTHSCELGCYLIYSPTR